MTAGVLLGVVLAQTATGEPSPAVLERVRKALEEPAPLSGAMARGGPVFRVKIEGFDLPSPWKDRSAVPAYVRAQLPLYHHEYLEVVTPEALRSGALFTIGIRVHVGQMISDFARAISAARHRALERRARHDVRAELAALVRRRTDPSKPGC